MYFKKLKGKFKIQKTYGMAISDAFLLRAPTISRNSYNTHQKTRPLRIGLNSILFKYKQNKTPRIWCYRGETINTTSLPNITKKRLTKKRYKFNNKKKTQVYTLIKLNNILKKLKTETNKKLKATKKLYN